MGRATFFHTERETARRARRASRCRTRTAARAQRRDGEELVSFATPTATRVEGRLVAPLVRAYEQELGLDQEDSGTFYGVGRFRQVLCGGLRLPHAARIPGGAAGRLAAVGLARQALMVEVYAHTYRADAAPGGASTARPARMLKDLGVAVLKVGGSTDDDPRRAGGGETRFARRVGRAPPHSSNSVDTTLTATASRRATWCCRSASAI